MEIAILSGRRAEGFTADVHRWLVGNDGDLKVKKVEVDTSNFRNGELNIKLLDSVRGSDVIIFQQFAQPGSEFHEDLFELFLLCDTASRAAANSITLCLPFIPYLRQDRKAEGREPISAKVLFNLLQKSTSGKLTRIITFDMHNPAEQGFTDFPLDNIPTMATLAACITKEDWFDPESTVVLAPDVGSAKKAEDLSSCLDLTDGVAIVHKERKKGQKAVAKSIVGDVKGKNIVMIDDIIDSGGTIMAAVDLLRANGAKRVCVMATHGIFSGGALEEFPGKNMDVVVTDSIPRDQKFLNENKWLKIISIAEYTGEVIYANAVGSSVSEVIERQHKLCCRACKV